MKYVMLQIDHAGLSRQMPVIFPNALSHDQVAAAMKALEGMEGAEPISAGFCTVNASCHGDSETLQLQSRADEDSTVINTHDQLHGLCGIDDLPPSVKAVLANMGDQA